MRLKRNTKHSASGRILPLGLFCAACFCTITLAFPAVSLAQLASDDSADKVVLVMGERGTARTRLTGEVIDYTGKLLRLKLPTGTERTFPAAQVIEIETKRTPEHARGLQLRDSGDYAGARDAFEAAARTEQRRWVRREILAEIVRCSDALGDAAAAGSYFLLLVGDDPDTPYFDQIPLNWENRQPDSVLASRAAGWLQQADNHVAVLLGASHLLSGSMRSDALLKLSSLKFDSDQRIASLARAQSWRTELVTSTAANVEQWNLQVRSMPETSQAGPYYMLGQAYNRLNQPELAALAYLRVPILFEKQPALARRSLIEAGRQFEKIGQPREAAGLYREAIERFPRVGATAEAQQLLDALR